MDGGGLITRSLRRVTDSARSIVVGSIRLRQEKIKNN